MMDFKFSNGKKKVKYSVRRMTVRTKSKKYLTRKLYQFVCENQVVVLKDIYRDGDKVIAVFEGYRDWGDVGNYITSWTREDAVMSKCCISAEYMFIITSRGVRWRAWM